MLEIIIPVESLCPTGIPMDGIMSDMSSTMEIKVYVPPLLLLHLKEKRMPLLLL